jgi:hypothetical protein
MTVTPMITLLLIFISSSLHLSVEVTMRSSVCRQGHNPRTEET